MAPAKARSLSLSTKLVGKSDRGEPGAYVPGFATHKCMMRVRQSDRVIVRHAETLLQKESGNDILLSAIVTTEGARHQDPKGNAVTIPPGSIVVFDLSAPAHVDLGHYSEINFSLRRDLVRAAIGKDPACLGGCVLSTTQLNGLLFSQLQVVAAALPSLTDHGREAALDSLADFALAALRFEVHGTTSGDAEDSGGLWDASHQYIVANLGQPGLTAASVARVLNCSRTYLYRVFANRGQTVMGYVKEQRLIASRNLLARPDCAMTIAEVAFHCGFENPSAFTRSFRRRYGYSPSELRRHRTSNTPNALTSRD